MKWHEDNLCGKFFEYLDTIWEKKKAMTEKVGDMRALGLFEYYGWRMKKIAKNRALWFTVILTKAANYWHLQKIVI